MIGQNKAGTNYVVAALFNTGISATDAIATSAITVFNNNTWKMTHISYCNQVMTLSDNVISLRYGAHFSTAAINGDTAGRYYGDQAKTSLTAIEVRP